VMHRVGRGDTKNEKKKMSRRTKKSFDVDKRVDEERGAASEPPKRAKEPAYEIGHRGVVEADE